MQIFIRPKSKEARRYIYMDLNEEQRREVDRMIFLPDKAFPKLAKGRPTKYDFLYIWIPNLNGSYVENVERYLSEKLDRPVFSYAKKIKDVNGYIFILPYRDVRTGKALPYTMKLYYTLRKDLYALARGEGIMPESRPEPEVRPEEKPEEKVQPEKDRPEIERSKKDLAKEILRYAEIIDKKEEKLKSLEAERDRQRYEIQRIKAVYGENTERVKRLQEEYSRLEDQITMEKADITAKNEYLEKLVENFISTDEKAMKLKREYDMKKVNLKRIEDKIKDDEKEVKELDEKINSKDGIIPTAFKRDIKRNKERREHLRNEIKSLKIERDQLKREIKELLDNLNERLEELIESAMKNP